MTILAPLVRLDDKSVRDSWRSIPVSLLPVRIQDVLNSDGRFNKTYHEILAAGGLHNFLDYDGPILLSMIMRDEIIPKMMVEKYVEAIGVLKPTFYTTVDGATYDKEEENSRRDLERIMKETEILVSRCPYSLPIGLVKGCNHLQVEEHTRFLKKLGIDDFIFHVGDFMRHGTEDDIIKGRFLASRIRPYARRLMLYGMGSQKRLIEFSFADVYITYNHFVTAKNGMMYVGSKKVKYIGKYNPLIVQHNLVQMYNNLKSLRSQTRLTDGGVVPWAEDLGAGVSITCPIPSRIHL